MQFLPIGQPPEEIDYDYVHASTASVTTKAAFTPTLYNGTTVSFVTEPLQKACVNTFYF